MATSSPIEKPSNNRKNIVLIAALVVFGIAGAAAAYYFLIGKHREPAAPAVVVVEEPIFVALEPFTVNLQPNGRIRFLHVALSLKLADTKAQSQATKYLPEVRSRILAVLSNRQPDSLLTSNDKTQLAGEITAALNQPFGPNLPATNVSSVLFTTFILQ